MGKRGPVGSRPWWVVALAVVIGGACAAFVSDPSLHRNNTDRLFAVVGVFVVVYVLVFWTALVSYARRRLPPEIRDRCVAFLGAAAGWVLGPAVIALALLEPGWKLVTRFGVVALGVVFLPVVWRGLVRFGDAVGVPAQRARLVPIFIALLVLLLVVVVHHAP